jgi:hypothetical protein
MVSRRSMERKINSLALRAAQRDIQHGLHGCVT